MPCVASRITCSLSVSLGCPVYPLPRADRRSHGVPALNPVAPSRHQFAQARAAAAGHDLAARVKEGDVSRRGDARKKGFWPIETYEDYIDERVSSAEWRELIEDPPGEPDQDYKNIVIANDSMAEWMAFNTIVSLTDRDLNFRNLLATYRLDTRQHIASVSGWLAQIKHWATGRALLKEIRSSETRHVRIVPSYGPGRKANTHTEDAVAATGKWRLVLPFKFGEVRTGS